VTQFSKNEQNRAFAGILTFFLKKDGAIEASQWICEPLGA